MSDEPLKTPTQEQAEKAQKELNNPNPELLTPAVPKTTMRTRYVYEVMEKHSLRVVFEISFFESDPENVLKKANFILIHNSANPAGLSLRLKYLEVLE